MAAQHIPGAFPASIPPTPADEPVQQPTQQYYEEQDQGHHHRQRNKLHKPNNPRGHAHTDSGVGLTESEPIQPTEENQERWVGPSEAVGGVTYVRGDIGPCQSSQPVQPSQTRQLDKDHSEEEFPIRKNNIDEKGLGATAVGAGAATRNQTTPENIDTTPRRSHEQRSDPPYWGDLPKASSGGIYNTVTGHGSAKDDHDQHHHLPQRSAASETSHLVGLTADFPRGTGVYNTVSGHGSQDTESRRHSQPTTSEDKSFTAGGPTGTMLAAPLSQIPEGQQKQTFTSSALETNRSNAPPSSLPESVARDNALPAAPGSAPTDRELDMSRQPVSSSPTQRAFPLAPSPQNVRDDVTSKSDNRNSALAGTAAFGAGAMAYGIADKHKNGKEETQPAPNETQARRSRSTSEDQGSRAAGGFFSRKSRDDGRNSSVDKHRSRSRSVHGEKKPKVLGIFHRHRDEDAPRDDTFTYEPPVQQAERKEEPILVGTSGTTKQRNRLRKASRSEPKDRKPLPDSPTDSDNASHKTKAAAGTLGLMHHNKDKDGKANESQTTTNQPIQQKDASFSSHPNQPLASQPPASTAALATQTRGTGVGAAVGLDALELSRKHDPAHPVPGTATPVGLATHKHDNPSTPFEHPREPPSPPRDEARDSHSWVPAAVMGAAASGVPDATRNLKESSTANPTTNQHTDTNVVYNTLPSGTSSGVQRDSADISPRGSTANRAVDTKRSVANEPGDYNVFVSSGEPLGSGRPSESKNSQKGSSLPHLTYNHLSSSTPSGGRQSESHGPKGGVVTQEPGAYNHLPSGTASGVKRDHSTDRSANTRQSGAGQVTQEPGAYNHLPSGTASGVKRDHSTDRSANTRQSGAGQVTQESGDCNQLPSGVAAAGVAAAGVAAHQSARGSKTDTSRQGTVTQEAGQYNHLASGTDSGIRRDSGFAEGTPAHNAAAAAVSSNRPSQDRTDSAPYNELASGTPSGVKIKPKDSSRRSTEPAVGTYDQHSSDRNASLPTGPTGGAFTQHRQSQPSNIDTRANDLKDLPLPASSSSPTKAHPSSHHTVVSSPVHAAPETGKATNPPPAAGQSATPRFTPFPNTVQGMSPEVMPESYRESVSKPHEQQGMSPEMMPEGYRDSVSRPSHQEVSPEMMPKDYREDVVGHNKFVSPALAAATGAWASSGNPRNPAAVGGAARSVPQGAVVHRCEHCGHDNDISSYVKEAMAKVTGGDRH